MTDIIEIMARAMWRVGRAGWEDEATLRKREDACWRAECETEAQAALTALHSQGFSVVPNEVTPAMVDAARVFMAEGYSDREEIKMLYADLLAAAHKGKE